MEEHLQISVLSSITLLFGFHLFCRIFTTTSGLGLIIWVYSNMMVNVSLNIITMKVYQPIGSHLYLKIKPVISGLECRTGGSINLMVTHLPVLPRKKVYVIILLHLSLKII